MHLIFVFIALFGSFLAYGLTLYDGSASGKKVMSTIFNKIETDRNTNLLNEKEDSLEYDVDAMVEEDFWNM